MLNLWEIVLFILSPIYFSIMNEQCALKYGSKFITKLNYSIVCGKPPKVDHINKIVYLEDNKDTVSVVRAISAILFWNTPKSLYNFFNKAYNADFGHDITNTRFGDYLYNTINYMTNFNSINRDKDIYIHFHPWINRSLSEDLLLATIDLINKMFDDDDNYFYSRPKIPPISITEYSIDKNLLDYLCGKFGACITGSIALACYGSVYRNNVHDVDFLVPTTHLTDEINDILNDEIEHNKIVGKRRIEVESKVKLLFQETSIYKGLTKLYKDVHLVNCFIDRVSDYDEYVKCTFTFITDNHEYDLIFKTEINKTYNPHFNCYIQDIGDILYSKTLLGRPKDYRDLIDFKPYNYINNQNTKCVTLL